MRQQYSNRGFSLLELIVTIIILAILATIAFLSFNGYTKSARDSARTSDMTNIQKGLVITKTTVGRYPIPDNAIEITASGKLVGYQGKAGESVLQAIKIGGAAKDPLSSSHYAYSVNENQTKYQLLGLVENAENATEKMAIFSESHGAGDSKKYITTKGDSLGILLMSGSLVPLEKQIATSFMAVDVVKTTENYIGVTNNQHAVAGNGLVLKDYEPNYVSRSAAGDLAFASGLGVDTSDNMYIYGYFENNSNDDNGTVDFLSNLLAGITTNKNTQNYYVAKLDKDGNQLWLKQLKTGNGCDGGFQGGYTDKAGNTYVSGYFNNSSSNASQCYDFNGNLLPGLHGNVSQDVFIAKLDSNGNQVWLKKMGGTSLEYITGVAADDSGYVYVAGDYRNNSADAAQVKDFSGNPLVGKTTTISSDGFVAKLDPQGNQLWIKTFGGTSDDWAQTIVPIPGIGMAVSGMYTNNLANSRGNLDFNNGTFLGKSSNDTEGDGFVAMLDESGNQQWIKGIGGESYDFAVNLSVDPRGYIYVNDGCKTNNSDLRKVRDFSGNPVLGYSPTEAYVSYIAQLDFSGQQKWIKTIAEGFLTTDVVMGPNNALYIGGSFNNRSTFIGLDGNNLESVAPASMPVGGFVAKIDSMGAQQEIKVFGGQGGNPWIKEVALGKSGNVILVGTYNNTTTNSNNIVDFRGYPLAGKATKSTKNIFIQKSLKEGISAF